MSVPAYKLAARKEQHSKQKAKRDYDKLFANLKEIEPKKLNWAPSSPRGSEQRVKSLTSTGNTPAPEKRTYTGDYIVGIATMHKSNLVPVCKDDQPEHYATMRRN